MAILWDRPSINTVLKDTFHVCMMAMYVLQRELGGYGKAQKNGNLSALGSLGNSKCFSNVAIERDSQKVFLLGRAYTC